MLGIAMALVTSRLVIGGLLLGRTHLLLSLGLTVIFGTLTWVLLRDYW